MCCRTRVLQTRELFFEVKAFFEFSFSFESQSKRIFRLSALPRGLTMRTSKRIGMCFLRLFEKSINCDERDRFRRFA